MRITRPQWMPTNPLVDRSTLTTIILGVVAVGLVALAVTMIIRGDEIAQSLLHGSSRTPSSSTQTASASDSSVPAVAPQEISPQTTSGQTAGPAGDTPDPSTSFSTAPLTVDEQGCTAQAYWEATRPANLAAMTVERSACLGAYGLVSLTQPPESADADPPRLNIVLRAVPDGWGVIATSTDLDCGALQAIDPGVPSDLCADPSSGVAPNG